MPRPAEHAIMMATCLIEYPQAVAADTTALHAGLSSQPFVVVTLAIRSKAFGLSSFHHVSRLRRERVRGVWRRQERKLTSRGGERIYSMVNVSWFSGLPDIGLRGMRSGSKQSWWPDFSGG